MRLQDDDFGKHLVLSRRNLLALLAKLDGKPPGSFCTLLGPTMYEPFAVTAEEDEAHYAHPSREGFNRPGQVHAETEARLQGA